MITLDKYLSYPRNIIIKSFIEFDEKESKWYKYVIKKGSGHDDFSIYKSADIHGTDLYVAQYGTKVTDPNQIRRLFDCTLAILKYYRY
jgi:hypothetical protein